MGGTFDVKNLPIIVNAIKQIPHDDDGAGGGSFP